MIFNITHLPMRYRR